MSSYICFHLKRKGVEKMDLFLSYCRSTKIYQCFQDSGIPFYYSNPEPFAEVTENMLNDILFEDIFHDYSDYKNWIKLANMFLQKHRMVTTEFNGKVETQNMYEWWDVRVRMGGVTFEKVYSTEDGYMRGRSINQEYIKSVL